MFDQPSNKPFSMIIFGFDENGNCPELVNRATRLARKFVNFPSIIDNTDIIHLFHLAISGDYPGVLFTVACSNIHAIHKNQATDINFLDHRLAQLIQIGRNYHTDEENPWHIYRQPDWEHFFDYFDAMDVYAAIGFMSTAVDEAEVFSRPDSNLDEQLRQLNLIFRKYVIQSNIAHIMDLWIEGSTVNRDAIKCLTKQYPESSQGLLKDIGEYIRLINEKMEIGNAPERIKEAFKHTPVWEQFRIANYSHWSMLGYGLMTYLETVPLNTLYFRILNQLDELNTRYAREIDNNDFLQFKPCDN